MSKPIIFFDLETTGVDVCKDRIVQISAWKLDADFKQIDPIKVMLVNPTIPIPEGASAVHGITDDDVKGAPEFRRIANSLFSFMQDSDLAGYNILLFDVPLLSEEFARCNIEWPANDVRYFDAYKIFVEKERRDLSGAAKFYLNKVHEGAHDARVDVMMTVQVAAQQLIQYEDIAGMTAVELSTFCIGKNAVDIAGKIMLNDAGVAVYAFGKDKGKSIKDNPGFANWMLKESFPTNTKNHLKRILNQQ